ncbi:hypothetical protein HHK36_025428 [Tetracentron sinense]|uniref:B-block binding subunit of TFIIIC domain-containing protein n=1 Tax=Tetracentron sinense TaxID=13715 RepID=A0A834YL53_TETSI|nr:hypothetical protein HHK36_025428 [Tetracentron sinense]
MDSIVCAALEEICAQGINGVSLPDLWPTLQASLSSSGLDLCSGVKKSIWNGLLNIPGLQFQAQNSSFASQDPSIQSFEDSEKMNLKIIAADHLRDHFVGLYDLKAADAGISPPQRRALERLAIARTNGITQSQLAKEFGMKGNNIFYVVRNLECRGLIVRQSTIVRTKEAGNEGETGLKNTSIVNTNLIHLYRYAKHLGSQQRLEITKEDTTLESLRDADGSAETGDGVAGECDVLVKDYLPALKAVCDKLEEADGKVLVVSDIKRALGYRGTSGHRAWRNIRNRLKDAHLVEEFCAEVNKKACPSSLFGNNDFTQLHAGVLELHFLIPARSGHLIGDDDHSMVVSCLRLVKKFAPKNFQPKAVGCGSDDFDTDQMMKFGKRGQITDQLVELPIEHQIYDMIDAEGSKGLTVTEVCKRLGINSKRNYTRLLYMFSRFGMHLQAESHNRGMVYRVWTSGNFNRGSSIAFPSKSEDVLDENSLSMQHEGDLVFHEKSAPIIPQLDSSASKYDFSTSGKTISGQMGAKLFNGSPGDGESNQLLICGSSPQELAHELGRTVPDTELDLVSESNVAPPEASSSAMSTPSKLRSFQRYPCLSLTAVSAQREQRILERLQEEKFILTVELYRWLESLEKDKRTTMARKTLARSLNKLQQEGHCKCVQVSVPVVTNCGRSRTTEVVLHPSVQNLPPELLVQIHERLRSFDMQSRGQGLSRLKKDQSVPVLTGVKRTQNSIDSDIQAARSESMRANGFVMAKMVRAKLLHTFLWGYLSSSPDWVGALSSGKHGYDQKNPHSTCKLFALAAAIKAMPLELFLQVVGSTQKFEDLIESCKRGLCLSDLPVQEYKCLMNTQATGRLSWIIDILRRLKLIRLVTGEYAEDAAMVPHAILTHAMELKPYIEEPASIVPSSSGFGSLDLRPRIRHDFILSNREAVDVYWKTLEYCYSAAGPTAALHAFPGSAVHEVFLFRSWVSTRVMTADQRSELLKCIVKDGPNKKLSFKECEKIAKDLNLTLEQVLRVYYDKRQQRLDRFLRDFKHEGKDFQPVTSKREPTSRKRKRSSKARSSKHVKIDDLTGQLSKQSLPILSDSDGQDTEEKNLFVTSLQEHDIHLRACDEDGHSKSVEDSGPNDEDDENYAFISQCAFSRQKPTRQRKFSWTETSDRQLVIQYVRHRAALGAKFHRANWASLPDLPAPPSTCRRRMALMNSNLTFRKAIMRLCNVLGERYTKHLDKTHGNGLLSRDNYGQMGRDASLGEGLCQKFSDSLEHALTSDFEEEQWDDFEDQNIKMALDEVLRCKRMAKLEASNRLGSVSEREWSDLKMDANGFDPQEEPELMSRTTPSEEIQNHFGRRHKESGRRSSCHRLPRKFIKLLNEGTSISRRAYESLAVSNAVELLKLVFLSTSTAPEVPNLLAETLRRYSEHDLFAAFSYLREKKFMVGGNGSQPFVLSQQFLHSVSSSPFPVDTGKDAAKFARWLRERENDLMEEGVNLSAGLQCGGIFHLCALVSLGELFISPCLPDEGIGEAEEQRSLKRKTYSELCNDDKVKKPKSVLKKEGEFVSRREKGFPGIMVSLRRETIQIADAVELFKDEQIHSSPLIFDENDQCTSTSVREIGSSSSHSDHLKASHKFGGSVTIEGASSDSPWEAMASYAEHMMPILSDHEQVGPFNPELFMTVYTAIHKAGDLGLSLEDVSQVMDLQGEKMAELIVDVLHAFELAVKVNAYDSIHAVDALYRSKYFLTSMDGRYHDLKPAPCTKSPTMSNDGLPENHENDTATPWKETSMNINNVHKVTILNLPEEVSRPSNEIQPGNEVENYTQVKVSLEGAHESETFECSPGDSHSFRPILPWINGDGTTNLIVYRGLTRRVLGTVMQNPGILEDDLICRMDVLNPQSCRKLLELMVLDNHLIVRKMHQTTSAGPPSILGSLFGSSFKKSKFICREHFFANPMSTSLL